MPVLYRDELVGTRRVDFFVEEKIMVELKALTVGKNYLEAYKMQVGLLINFGAKSLEVKKKTN